MKTIASNDPNFLEFLGKQEAQYLASKDTYTDNVKKIISGDVEFSGDLLPWTKTHDRFRLRPGELTIWASANGHGKSLITGQIALWLSRHTKVLMASLEMRPEQTLQRMVRQAAGCEQPSEQFIEQFFAWKPDNLWIYDQLDSVESDRIIAMSRYVARNYGIKHIFIDSLMKCGLGTDDYNAQKGFCDRLCWVAKSEKVHIHLIHHIRKGETELKRPGKYDVKGAGELVDLCDNLVIPWRNKPKEAEYSKYMLGQRNKYDEKEPDMFLTVEKQRHDDWEGSFGLWREVKSMQYIPNHGRGPMPFDL